MRALSNDLDGDIRFSCAWRPDDDGKSRAYATANGLDLGLGEADAVAGSRRDEVVLLRDGSLAVVSERDAEAGPVGGRGNSVRLQ